MQTLRRPILAWRALRRAVGAGESGQALTEYALLGVLVAVGVVGAVALIAPDLHAMYMHAANCLQTPTGAGC